MTGTDPAIEAAQRAIDGPHGVAAARDEHAAPLAVDAAREALAPIRAWYLRFDPAAPLNESMDDLVRFLYIRRGGGCWYIGQPPAGCPDTVDYASTVWMSTTFEAAIKTANTLARTGKLPNGQTPEEFLR